MTLTWQNVAAPDFSAAIAARRAAAESMNSGFNAIQTALANYQANQQKSDASAVLAESLKYSDPEAYNKALAAGTIVGNHSIDAATAEALSNRAGTLLSNVGKDIGNQKDAWVLSTSQRDDALKMARDAAQPAAMKLLADVRMLSSSGNPGDVETARKMLADTNNIATLKAAGFDSGNIQPLLDAERQAGINGYDYKNQVHDQQTLWAGQARADEARTLANDRMNNLGTPELGIRSIQEDPNIKDPQTKALAIKYILDGANANIYVKPSQAEVLAATVNPGSTNMASPDATKTVTPATAPAQQPANDGNIVVNTGQAPMMGLLSKVEANSWDALFGNAQSKDSPFANVQVSKMTLGQLDQMDKGYGPWVRNELAKNGQDPRIATPMGRFQIVGDTRRRVAQAMGLSPDTVFDAKTQMGMFNFLVNERLSSAKTMDGKISALRSEWEGFKNVKNEDLANAITAWESGDPTALSGFTQGQTTPVNFTGLPGQMMTPANVNNNVGLPSFVAPGAQARELLLGSQAAAANQTPATNDPVSSLTAPQDQNSYAQKVAQENKDKPVDPSQKSWQDYGLKDAASQLYDYVTSGPSSEETAARRQAAWTKGGYLPNNDQQAQNPAATQGERANATPGADTQTPAVQPTPIDPATSADNLVLQSLADRAFSGNSALAGEFVKAVGSPDTTPQQAAANLVKEGGLVPGGNVKALEDSIAKIREKYPKVTVPMAAVMAASSLEQTDLRNKVLPNWLYSPGDRWSTPNENLGTADRVNMDKVDKIAKDIGIKVDGSIDKSLMADMVRAKTVSEVAPQQVQAIKAQIQDINAQIVSLQIVLSKSGKQPDPRNVAELQKLLTIRDQLASQLPTYNGLTSLYTNATADVPAK